MQTKIPAVCLALLVVFVQPAAGAFKSGSELLTACTSKGETALVECLTYIVGIYDGIEHMMSAVDFAERQHGGSTVPDIAVAASMSAISKSYGVCLPKGVVATQLRDIVVAYLRGKAPQIRYAASTYVADALQTKFACK